ncbi:MAG: DUF4384 domain-containing protein [Nitrospira sp.]|nr:DUF4384 domain-containing protein [Nitrospira sp.]
MSKKSLLFLIIISISVLIFSLTTADAKSGKGAKAIFDSGEGPSVGMSVTRAPARVSEAPAQKEKYTGISYQLALLSDDGQFKIVPKSRTFRTGEKIKMLIRTNRPGYMTILNVGPTGRTNVLFNDYVEAFTIQEIPRNTNFRFAGNTGVEKVLVMLSDNPNPIGNQTTTTASAPPPPVNTTAVATPPPPPPPPSSGYETATSSGTPLPPPPAAMIASIEGAKSIKGSKDIVVEDSMQNTYTVVSPKNGWKPIKGGMKDIVLESSGGSNYGVIPASAIADGGILTLEIKLRHR